MIMSGLSGRVPSHLHQVRALRAALAALHTRPPSHPHGPQAQAGEGWGATSGKTGGTLRFQMLTINMPVLAPWLMSVSTPDSFPLQTQPVPDPAATRKGEDICQRKLFVTQKADKVKELCYSNQCSPPVQCSNVREATGLIPNPPVQERPPYTAEPSSSSSPRQPRPCRRTSSRLLELQQVATSRRSSSYRRGCRPFLLDP